jgi:hypothetical protein
MPTTSFLSMARSSIASTERSKPMSPTYADILTLSAAPRQRADRPAHMPLLGLLSGLALALVLWSAIGGLMWALLA